jgi:hypothetical protein
MPFNANPTAFHWLLQEAWHKNEARTQRAGQHVQKLI